MIGRFKTLVNAPWQGIGQWHAGGCEVTRSAKSVELMLKTEVVSFIFFSNSFFSLEIVLYCSKTLFFESVMLGQCFLDCFHNAVLQVVQAPFRGKDGGLITA